MRQLIKYSFTPCMFSVEGHSTIHTEIKPKAQRTIVSYIFHKKCHCTKMLSPKHSVILLFLCITLFGHMYQYSLKYHAHHGTYVSHSVLWYILAKYMYLQVLSDISPIKNQKCFIEQSRLFSTFNRFLI